MKDLVYGYSFSSIYWTITGALNRSYIELSVIPSSGDCSMQSSNDSGASFTLEKKVDHGTVNPISNQLNWGAFTVDVSSDEQSNLSVAIASSSSKQISFSVVKSESGYKLIGLL